MQSLESYRSIPFWSWNDELEPEKLVEQIKWMNQKGMGGFFMHARSGLKTEYLSEKWMQCIEICADEAKNLGMKAWVYDENGWPSGFVGGKLLEDEKNCDKYILTSMGEYDAQATVTYFLTENKLIRVDSREKEGKYLNLYIHTSVSSVDILNPDVVDKFLALTHEKYNARFGEAFSEKIEGFFTDEPQYYRWHTPYTDMIRCYFQEHYEQDILDYLGLLFVEKEGYRLFRYRYWKAMQFLMLEGFAKRVYSWCNKWGVKLTGHYIEESTMMSQMWCCGGIMPFYEYEHIPGIDWLGKNTATELPVKQVGSVAAQLGKKRVITETFGCCGWDVKPSELRRIASFQYVNGVNMMCQHLIPYSERGNRKYDYPAHFSSVNPWVQESFKTFNDYYTKLGYILGEGEKYVNVAMLHPIRSVYFDYKRELENEEFGIGQWDKSLLKACRMLSARGIDYHFLDETLLEKYGSVEEGCIRCGQCTYDYLVLPRIITMDKSTEKLLYKYVKQGGKILLLEGKPEYLEADEFSYEYLKTNISLDEIINAQVYSVTDTTTEIYSTYRILEGKSYLYVMNNSSTESQTQAFDFGSDIHSFKRLDLLTMEEEKIPLTITLKPGEDALLIPCRERVCQGESLMPYKLCFENAEISVQENYLPIDYVRYSKEGKEYSRPWPCVALFQKLLEERYEGELFLRYEFEIDTLPKKICLKAEKSNDLEFWLNGQPLYHNVLSDESYEHVFDITELVMQGKNEYTVKVNWFQREKVYFALFGDNVTESLRNCIVYDTELQPIELLGVFGVYPKNGYVRDEDKNFVRGEEFYIGELPTTVTEPSMEGFPFLAGEMVLSSRVFFETEKVLLQLAGNYSMAFVKVNGQEAGQMFFDTQLDISQVAKIGENHIEVRFVLDNRNRMGPHHLKGDKEQFVSSWNFTLFGEWTEDKSPKYHKDYDIKKFWI